MGTKGKQRRGYGNSMEERQHNRLESRLRMMGDSKRKMTRALDAQTEMIEQGIVGAHLPPVTITKKDTVPVAPAEKPKTKRAKGTEYPEPLVMVAQLMDIFANLPTLYEKVDESVNKMDMELGDLNHAVELCDLPKKETYALMQEIKKNRTERRKAKDFLQKAKPLYDFIKGKGAMTASIVELQKELVRLNEALGRRTYTPRVREDLKELFTGKGETAATNED